MKKISLYIFLVFIWCNLSVNANAVPKTKSGKGELFLSEKIIEGYYDYVTNNRLPLIFFISEDKQDFYTVIINQDGKGVAGSGYILKKIPKCQTKLKQKCYVFSNSRHIVWDNGINPRKGKKSKISSKIPKEDLIIKLSELGFIETKEQKAAKENKVVEDKAAKENKVVEDKAAKDKRIAKDKAAKEKKIAEQKVAEEKKIAEQKVAEEKKIAEQKVAEDKLNKKLSLIPAETDLEKAQNFLKNLQDFMKLYPDEFDIIKISEFFILTRPVLNGDLNYKSKKDLEQFKEFTNTSGLFVKYNNDIEKNKRVNKLNKINEAISNLENNIKIIKGFLVTDPNSIYLEEWLNSVKNAELIIDNPSSYDQLLKTNDDLIRLTKSKNEIDEVIAELNNNIDELKETLKQNLTTDLAPLLLEQAKLLETVIRKQILKDMNLANKKFEEFIYKNIEEPKLKAAEEKRIVDEKAAEEARIAEEKRLKNFKKIKFTCIYDAGRGYMDYKMKWMFDGRTVFLEMNASVDGDKLTNLKDMKPLKIGKRFLYEGGDERYFHEFKKVTGTIFNYITETPQVQNKFRVNFDSKSSYVITLSYRDGHRMKVEGACS